MKKILSILTVCFALALTARAQLVTATVTFSNTPANGATLTVRGFQFYWTNGTPLGNYSMLITNSFGGDATNIFNTAGLILPSYGVQTINNGTNIQFVGISLTASISSGWASLVLNTNGTSNPAWIVETPIANGGVTATAQTNVDSALVLDLNWNSTNALDQTAPVTSQLVGLTNHQTISGVKTFTASGAINGNLGNLTNGTFTNPVFTNGQNYGAPFRSPGGGTGSEQFGVSASATTNYATAFGDSATASAPQTSAFGYFATANAFGATSLAGYAGGQYSLALYGVATNQAAVAVGYLSVAGGQESIAVGNQTTATGDVSGAIGFNSSAAQYGSFAIGNNVSTTTSNQIALNNSTGSVWIPGTLQVSGGMSNLTMLGPVTMNASSANTLGGTLVYPASVNSSLANGNNVVSISTGFYVQVSGPTSSFTIGGITGGTDGRVVQIENTSGQTMTVANQSGIDSYATNRIITMTGSDRVISNNVFTVRYDGSLSRWKIVSVN